MELNKSQLINDCLKKKRKALEEPSEEEPSEEEPCSQEDFNHEEYMMIVSGIAEDYAKTFFKDVASDLFRIEARLWMASQKAFNAGEVEKCYSAWTTPSTPRSNAPYRPPNQVMPIKLSKTDVNRRLI